jgi:hypothetical protein
MKTYTQIQKHSLIDYKNPSSKQRKHIMFFICVLESQNMKNKTPKPHYGDKAPKYKKLGTSSHHIGFHMLIVIILQKIRNNYHVLLNQHPTLSN